MKVMHMMTRWITILGAAMFCFVPQHVSAKEPEMGGPRQFDLDCRGQEKQVIKRYLPGFHKTGIPGEKNHYSVRTHLTIDMVGMKFQEKPPAYSGAPPDKIFKYDGNDAILVLQSDPHLATRWAIRLDNYNSTAVNEDGSGEIWVQY